MKPCTLSHRAYAACGIVQEKMMKYFICGLLLCFSLASFGQKSFTKLDDYNNKVLLATVSCEVKQAEYREDGSAGKFDEFLKCVSTQKNILKDSYDLAVKTLRKPAAKTALKEHYLGMVSYLQGLDAVNDETKRAYASRQAVNKQRLSDLWTRFEVENP